MARLKHNLGIIYLKLPVVKISQTSINDIIPSKEHHARKGMPACWQGRDEWRSWRDSAKTRLRSLLSRENGGTTPACRNALRRAGTSVRAWGSIMIMMAASYLLGCSGAQKTPVFNATTGYYETKRLSKYFEGEGYLSNHNIKVYSIAAMNKGTGSYQTVNLLVYFFNEGGRNYEITINSIKFSTNPPSTIAEIVTLLPNSVEKFTFENQPIPFNSVKLQLLISYKFTQKNDTTSIFLNRLTPEEAKESRKRKDWGSLWN